MSFASPIFEDHELLSEGVRLWWGRSLPQQQARAEVVLTHGLGEHAHRYEHVAERLARRGIRVIAYDVRGHGRSGGPRGDAPTYDSLLQDLRMVAEHGPLGHGPLFFMGHSMGGQITLAYLQQAQPLCRGAIIASPWLRLAFAPPRWKLALARLTMRWWPAFTQRTPGEVLRLSRDAAHLASLPSPELTHKFISTRLFFAIQEAGERVLAEADHLRTPLLLLHGEADEVTSPRASAEFFEKVIAADKKLLLLPDTLHETHNDLGREQVFTALEQWLEERIGPEGALPP